ncbi:MAG: nucleoside-diphosphate kinase [Candidatus Aureabacteria bacterium]|nr:nucleoside-diphosphate kinase [Candidatus Auribacterota bacterium]
MGNTLLIVKPDAYERGLEAAILDRVRGAGLDMVRSERRRLARAEVEALYGEHRGKLFYAANTEFILSGPVGLFLLNGPGDIVRRVRVLVGHKDPGCAAPGSIRGDFGIDPRRIERNLVHASSTPEDAEREISLFFGSPAVGVTGTPGCSKEPAARKEGA